MSIFASEGSETLLEKDADMFLSLYTAGRVCEEGRHTQDLAEDLDQCGWITAGVIGESELERTCPLNQAHQRGTLRQGRPVIQSQTM